MEELKIPIEIDRHQASILYDLVQAEIVMLQHRLRSMPSQREPIRKRIIALQHIRRQIPTLAIPS